MSARNWSARKFLIVLFTLLFSGTALAQYPAPDLTLTRGAAGSVNLVVTHPQGVLTAVDWSTFYTEAVAPLLGVYTPVDVTGGFIGLATNRAFGNISFNQTLTNVTITITNFNLTGISLVAQLCAVGGPCASSVRMLRDASCYPSTNCTAANNPMGSGMTSLTGAFYDSSPFYFTSPGTTVITKFRGIGNGFGTVNFNNYQFVLNVWQATATQTVEQVWVNSPNNGNVVNQLFLNETHQTFGSGYAVELTPQSGNSIAILPPGNYLISVAAAGSPGWYWNETTTNLGSDIATSDVLPPGIWYTYTALNYNPGSQALDLFGY